MTFAIAPMIIAYFSQDENAGGAPGLLSVWKRAQVRISDRDADGPMVAVLGIRGNISPQIDADLDITDSSGRKREGHLMVTTVERLQVDDEATGATSFFILHEDYYYFLEEQSSWHYAGGYVYRATRDRRESDV